VRLADVLFRSGHLSDRALVDACMTGERPAHMDRCDICAERAIEFGRWLDDVRALGDADVDAVFPAERMAAQQAQIMRKLEQLDQPSRVIAFPKHIHFDDRVSQGRRVAPGWLAAAAAAGLVLGVVGTKLSSELTNPTAAPAPVTQSAQVDPAQVANISRVDEEEMTHTVRAGSNEFEALDRMTPRALPETQGAIILASLPSGPGRR
jgi:anti-sigma factor RsiW